MNKEFLNKLDIVKVISEYVSLTKVGKNYKGVCPFHNDKNPSMIVSPDKQIYKCFSCGAGGNAIKFVQDKENLTFQKSVENLATKFQIPLPNNINTNIDTKKAKYLEINKIAMECFQYNLSTDLACQKYLRLRNIDEDILESFNLGYIHQGQQLLDVLIAKGYSDLEILNSGLANEKENKLTPFFNNRLMIPIFDNEKNCLGFSGRTLGNDSIKYLNSKETEYFKKQQILYNEHIAFESSKEKNSCILVEGYMDVFAFFHVGIKNVFATMGTTLSQYHIRKIQNYTKNIILAFDNDAAGKEIVDKYGALLKSNKMNVSIINYQDVKDADEYLQKYGANKLIELIEQKIDFLSFYIQSLNINKTNLDLKKQDEVLKKIEAFLYFEDNDFLNLLANNLANIINLDSKLIYERFQKIIKNKNASQQFIIDNNHYYDQISNFENENFAKYDNKKFNQANFKSKDDYHLAFQQLFIYLIHPNIITHSEHFIMKILPFCAPDYHQLLIDLKKYFIYQNTFIINIFLNYYPANTNLVKKLLENNLNNGFLTQIQISEHSVQEMIWKFAKSAIIAFSKKNSKIIYSNPPAKDIYDEIKQLLQTSNFTQIALLNSKFDQLKIILKIESN